VVDYNQFGDSRVRLKANLSIQPARLGLPVEVNAQNALSFLQERVSNGLRARLASASLLTGGLKVELVMVEEAPAARIEPAGPDTLPVLPTTANETTDTAATVEGVFTRINNLPIEELLSSAISLLNSTEAFINDEDLRETPQDVRLLLADISDLVSSEDVQNIPTALNATLTRIEGLVAELEERQLTDRLLNAIDTVSETAEGVTTSIEGVPDLVADLQAVAQKAEALELEELVTQVSALLAAAETVIASEDTAALPGDLRAALDQVNTTLAELRAGGLVNNINQTLASARLAADNVAATSEELPQITARLNQVLEDAAAATADIQSATEGVPELVERIQRIAAKAETLEVEELLRELTELTETADRLLGSEDVAEVPGALKRALDEVNFALQELREGGVIENVNQTLASARNAADTVALSVEDLPAIVQRLNALFSQASRTIEGYNRGDEISRSVRETLREIQKAADALGSLARTIERNPNSLLLGR
jgi:paraquat-inducible protein B